MAARSHVQDPNDRRLRPIYGNTIIPPLVPATFALSYNHSESSAFPAAERDASFAQRLVLLLGRRYILELELHNTREPNLLMSASPDCQSGVSVRFPLPIFLSK